MCSHTRRQCPAAATAAATVPGLQQHGIVGRCNCCSALLASAQPVLQELVFQSDSRAFHSWTNDAFDAAQQHLAQRNVISCRCRPAARGKLVERLVWHEPRRPCNASDLPRFAIQQCTFGKGRLCSSLVTVGSHGLASATCKQDCSCTFYRCGAAQTPLPPSLQGRWLAELIQCLTHPLRNYDHIGAHTHSTFCCSLCADVRTVQRRQIL